MIFKPQFETAAKHNKWTEEEKELIMTLQGKAADLLQTMLDCLDYTKLLETMEKRFGNTHMGEKVFRNELLGMVHKPGETLQELEADVGRIAYLDHQRASTEFIIQP